MVVAEQVEDAVNGEQHHLLHGAVTCRGRLLGRDPGAYDEVAEHALHRGLAVAGPQLVHREAHHVGRAFQRHPPLMQLGYGIGIHEQDGQIGLGTHAHLVHHPQAQVGERLCVDVPDGLVGHFHAHRASSRDSLPRLRLTRVAS